MDSRFPLAGTSNVRLISIEPRGRLASGIFATDGSSFLGLDTEVHSQDVQQVFSMAEHRVPVGSSFTNCKPWRRTARMSTFFCITEQTVMQIIGERTLAVSAHAI